MSQFFVIFMLYQNKGVIMKKILISTIAVSALMSSLYAGGKLVEPPHVPPVAVVTDMWSGPYVGAQIGYLSGKGKVDISSISNLLNRRPVPVNYDRLTLKPNGFIGGVFIGANRMLQNNWLIGIELDANYVNAKKSGNILLNGNNTANKFTLKQSDDFALFARVGKVFGENQSTLAYLLAGGTMAKLKGGLTVGGTTKWDSDRVSGWTVGAGLEYKVNKNWHVRAQYRYSKYGNSDTLKYTFGSNDYSAKIKDYKTHIFQLGVSYHFK